MALLLQDGTSLLLQDGTDLELQGDAGLDQYIYQTQTILHGGGTTVPTDDSLSPSTWTLRGGASIVTGHNPFGTDSMYFDGVGDAFYMGRLHDKSAFLHNGLGGTFECTIEPEAITSSHVISDTGAGASASVGSYLAIQSAGELRLYIGRGVGGSGAIDLTTATGLIVAGNTYQVAYETTPTGATIFIDGVVVASGAWAQTPSINAQSYDLQLGLRSNFLDTGFKGWMSNVRITSAARFGGAAYTPETAAFDNTVDTGIVDAEWANVELLVMGGEADLSTTIVDSSDNALVANIAAGTPVYDATANQGRFTSSAIKMVSSIFNYTTMPHGTSWTLEWRQKKTGTALSYWINNRTDPADSYLAYNNGTTEYFWTLNQGQSTYSITGGYFDSYMISYDGSNIRLFFNGKVMATRVAAAVVYNPILVVGGYLPGLSTFTDGWMEMIRFTSGVARETTDYNPPVSYYPMGAAPTGTPVSILTQPVNSSVAEGVTATFTVVAQDGTLPYSYQWYNAVGDVALVEGVTGDNVTTDTLSIDTVLGDDGNTYYVIVTDSA